MKDNSTGFHATDSNAIASSYERFTTLSQQAIDDPKLRKNFRSAMDGLQTKRHIAFDDKEQLEQLRVLGAAVRQRALNRLPQLLEELETRLLAAGINVHWAQSPEEAINLIKGISVAEKAASVIKGKSMVSEEIHLNDALESIGIECLESDLGEYILQLAKETPSHIVMPAIHKNTTDIMTLMEEKLGIEAKPDANYLTTQARLILREKFQQADIGLSGVNFAVAETGTLCLVENEGNGRLSTTVPKTHIAIMGIEKVVEKLEDVTPLLSLLTRSATGQAITTYFNMISSPRKEGEKDGPETIHLVLLDNGRSDMYQDNEMQTTLRCIRCAACMNHCPVYTRIGGHAYGYTYPGPIGKILMPHLEGLENTQALPTASSLCGACAEVCPVKIPIPDLLVRQREQTVQLAQVNQTKKIECMVWRIWCWFHQSGFRYQLMINVLGKTRWLHPFLYKLPFLNPWSRSKCLPRVQAKSLHQLMREKQSNRGGKR